MGLLDGKVALVTGSGHGIGRGHALELAKQGAKVVVNDLGSTAAGEGRGQDADRVVEIIHEAGGEAIADYGDVGDEAQAAAMVAAGIETWGRLDIVVNNAGIVRDRAVWNMEVDDFDLVMRVHIRGTWLVSRAAARHWRDQSKQQGGPVGGRLVNTVSGAGLLGNFGQSNYATAKAAIMGLTLTLSVELASIGVTVNAIGPGAVTRLSAGVSGVDTAKEPDEYDPDGFDPLNPAMSSPVVAWLASDQAAHVSGQCIRAMRTQIHLMQGWTEAVTIDNGGAYWDATKLGRRMDTELFRTRAPGLTLPG
ncbi:MAG TPA: SDR family NAD(P)-dependent oxidoreductase [Acidimicrobiales bacterium]|jgi:NAD(P)-dependent dehydrogenase (short-subunit alcohol dehydrogenase family)